MVSGLIHDEILPQHEPTTEAFLCIILRISTLLANLMVASWHTLRQRVMKKGRSGVCALWPVTEPSRRRRKVSMWLHEDDGLDTGGELPINALPQRTNGTQTNNLRATRSIPQLTARPTIMPLPDSIFMQLTTCMLLGSASTPPHYHSNKMSSLIQNLKSGHTSAAETLALLKSLLIHEVRPLPGVKRRSQIMIADLVDSGRNNAYVGRLSSVFLILFYAY